MITASDEGTGRGQGKYHTMSGGLNSVENSFSYMKSMKVQA